MKRLLFVLAALAVSTAGNAQQLMGAPVKFRVPPAFAVTCTKVAFTGGIDINCIGSGGSANGRLRIGDRHYDHYAGKPATFACRAGFGVAGPFSTGAISC